MSIILRKYDGYVCVYNIVHDLKGKLNDKQNALLVHLSENGRFKTLCTR